jgi:hypothetical protein
MRTLIVLAISAVLLSALLPLAALMLLGGVR